MAELTILLCSSLLLLPGISAASSLPKDLSGERHTDGVFCVTWQASQDKRTAGFRISIDQDIHAGFPLRVVDEVGPHAESWCSQPRRSWPLVKNLTGVDMRDPSQWFDGRVLTPGESYRVGVERVLEGATAGPDIWKRHIIAYPFLVSIYQGGQTVAVIPVDKLQLKRLPPALMAFVVVKGAKAFIRLGDEKLEILRSETDKNGLRLYLKNGVLITYTGVPRRPEVFGNAEAARRVVLFLALLILLFSGLGVWLGVKALHYLNLLAEEDNAPADVIRTLFETERWPVGVLYFMVMPERHGILGKILPVKVEDLSPPARETFDNIVSVMRKLHISEHRAIKTKLLELVAVDRKPDLP